MRKTRQKDLDVPGPQSPWDEIAPGLWMGGHYWTDPAGEPRPVVVGAEFELVISLFTRPGHGPDPHVEHLVGEPPDAGRRILVRCHSGDNRSGLVVAQCLDGGRLAPAAAIGLVRLGRSPRALHDETFTEYLAAGRRSPRCSSTSTPTWIPIPIPNPNRERHPGRRPPVDLRTPLVVLGARTRDGRRTVSARSPTVESRLRGGTRMRTAHETAPGARTPPAPAAEAPV